MEALDAWTIKSLKGLYGMGSFIKDYVETCVQTAFYNVNTFHLTKENHWILLCSAAVIGTKTYFILFMLSKGKREREENV